MQLDELVDNRAYVGKAIDFLTLGLGPYVEQCLKEKIKGDWHQEARNRLLQKWEVETGQELRFDCAKSLLALEKFWMDVFRDFIEVKNIRSEVRGVRKIRNDHAHQGWDEIKKRNNFREIRLYTSSRVKRDLENIKKLLSIIGLEDCIKNIEKLEDDFNKKNKTRNRASQLRSLSLEECNRVLELTSNMMNWGEDFEFERKEIYVPLGLVERHRNALRQKANAGKPDKGSDLYRGIETETVQPLTEEEFFAQVLENSTEKQRVALIGEPGSGKTTRLQKIVDWILGSRQEAGEIAIWISLRDIPKGKSLREYLFDTWLINIRPDNISSDAWKETLDDQIRSGKVWLLLDGADEMSINSPLTYLKKQLAQSWMKSVHVVMTCRLNLWEANKNVLDVGGNSLFKIFRNLDFDSEQISEVINLFLDEQGKTLYNALTESGKERIFDLVRNPLRLTLLCSLWQRGDQKLPETKFQLYQKFAQVIYDWKDEEICEKYGWSNVTYQGKQQELTNALGELSKQALDQENSRFRLRRDFVKNVMDRFGGGLLQMALDIGWLNVVGVAEEDPTEQVYAFYHPTFEEYFAALAINDWGFFLPKNHTSSPVINFDGSVAWYRIFNSTWHEVFLLWMGRSTENIRKQKPELFEKLVDFQDGCGDFYLYRAYALAMIATTEYTDFPGVKEIIKRWYEAIWKNRSLAFTGFRDLPPDEPLFSVRGGFPLHNRSTYHTPIVKERWWDVLQKVNRQLLFGVLVEVIKEQNEKDQQIRETLRQQIAKPSDSIIKNGCHLNVLETLSFLARLDFECPKKYINYLIELIDSIQDVRQITDLDALGLSRASEALIYFGQSMEKAVVMLIKLGFQDYRRFLVSYETAEEIDDAWDRLSKSKANKVIATILSKKLNELSQVDVALIDSEIDLDYCAQITLLHDHDNESAINYFLKLIEDNATNHDDEKDNHIINIALLIGLKKINNIQLATQLKQAAKDVFTGEGKLSWGIARGFKYRKYLLYLSENSQLDNELIDSLKENANELKGNRPLDAIRVFKVLTEIPDCRDWAFEQLKVYSNRVDFEKFSANCERVEAYDPHLWAPWEAALAIVEAYPEKLDELNNFDLTSEQCGQLIDNLVDSDHNHLFSLTTLYSRLNADDDWEVIFTIAWCINRHYGSNPGTAPFYLDQKLIDLLAESPHGSYVVELIASDFGIINKQSQKMSYPSFYEAWNNPNPAFCPPIVVKSQNNTLLDIDFLLNDLKFSINYSCAPIQFPDTNDLSEAKISQRIVTEIFRVTFPDEQVPTVAHLEDVRREIENRRQQISGSCLAIVIYNTEPANQIIRACEQLTPSLNIGWITDQQIESKGTSINCLIANLKSLEPLEPRAYSQ